MARKNAQVHRTTQTYTTIDGLTKGLNKLPKEAQKRLRDRSQRIARTVADEAKGRAAGIGRSYSLVGPTLKDKRDRTPVIEMGGTKKIPGRKGKSTRQTVGDLIWGSEFGGGARRTTRQFLPHLGTEGYALWPTIRERSDWMTQQWMDGLTEAVDATVMQEG